MFFDETEFISENPKSGKDYNDVRKGYYRSKVKSHYIFYKINQKEEEIEIVRILHQQMGIASKLYE